MRRLKNENVLDEKRLYLRSFAEFRINIYATNN
jgi:hypothetical protein